MARHRTQPTFKDSGSRKADRRKAASTFAGLLAAALALGAVTAGVLGTWAGLAAGLCAFGIGLTLCDGIMRKPGGIPCLTWHSVSADASWLPWAAETSVTPDTLDRQLTLLRDIGLNVVDTRAFVAARRTGRAVPDNSVMLHFDDGYLDNLIAAAPLLRKHRMTATMFVSLDFMAPDRKMPAPIDTAAPGPLGADYTGRWDGYLSWSEIAALDGGAFGGAFDIQPHGVDHGRVATGPEQVDTLAAGNWRKLAWMQWARMPGDKHDWYRHRTPPAVPLGSPVPPSDSALAARAWRDGAGLETEAEFEARVLGDLRHCVDVFAERLDKIPEIFCWPQNRATPASRAIAARAGFTATTAGAGNNRAGEPATIISRLHVGERYAGFESRLIDDIAFRASVRAFQGNHYWYLLLIPMHLVKKLHGRRATRAAVPPLTAPAKGLGQ